MKKVVCLLTVLLLFFSLACPAFAAEGFVPSISDKDEPTIVPPAGDENAIGLIRDAEGNILDYITEDCLVITPLSKVKTSASIPAEAVEVMLAVYAALSDGSMILPYDKLGLDAEKMAIRDLIDASWLCGEHPEMLEPEGVVLELTFDLGVSAGDSVYVMTYKNNAWNSIANVENNGDGTVTCVFEHLCPIAFCVYDPADAAPPATGDNSNVLLWGVLAVASAAAVVVILASQRKRAC